ncbi:hypothetical protein PHYC_01801 [Phycisphaerales bacterium]|nr:hypothetical protein PHYC_01801 [Phycisphaerales bacterium]
MPGYTISSPRQIAAIASPIRQEIVDVIAATGPATIAHVAFLLGRRPDSLYYHVGALQRAGLLLPQQPRREGQRPASVYDVPGRPLRMASNRAPAAASRVIAGALSLARRDFSRVVASPATVFEGPDRDVWGARLRARLSPDRIRRVNELLSQVADLFQEPNPSDDARPFAITWVFAPAQTGRAPKKESRS